MRKRNEFGNFDDKRRKFGDPLVYRPAAFSFFFFRYHNDLFLTFFSALAPFIAFRFTSKQWDRDAKANKNIQSRLNKQRR